MSCSFSVDFLVSLVFCLILVGVLFAFLFGVVFVFSWFASVVEKTFGVLFTGNLTHCIYCCYMFVYVNLNVLRT